MTVKANRSGRWHAHCVALAAQFGGKAMPWRGAMAMWAVLALAGPARAADKVTYILDWLPSGEETFPWIAQTEGLFAREGLDVTINVGRGTTDVITRMATGSAQFGSGGMNGLMTAAAEHGVPVRAVFSVFSKQPDAILTVQGGPITSIKSLAGHTLGTATFTSSNTIWPVIARQNGLDPADVNLLKVDPATLGPLLATGKVDALIDWVTSGTEIEEALKAVGKTMHTIPWSDSGLTGYGLSLFATDAMINDHPDIVARFVRAYAEAVRRSVASCAEGARAIHKALPEVDAALAEPQCGTTIALISNEISQRDGLGWFDPALLAETWSWVARAQNYPPDRIDPQKLVDTRFVPRM